MKDYFSINSDQYLKFRPSYPDALYDFLLSKIPGRKAAWDCATGNGQVAFKLSEYFEKVYATDISENQISNAAKRENIIYQVEPAEHNSFPGNTFDLITVAQAIHWFDIPEFYKEVERTIRPGGIFAVIGYGLPQSGIETDKIIRRLYKDITGRYWDEVRKLVDENYQTIPFPFNEIKSPQLEMEYDWTFEQVIGFLQTWSGVNQYIIMENSNPIDLIYNELRKLWPEGETRKVRFPVLLRAAQF